MKRILLSFIFLASSILASAQNSGTVNGQIVDTNNETLPGITINLLNTSFRSSTDSEGKFSFKNVPNGSYTIQATGIGFSAEKQNLLIAGKALNIQFQLNAATNTLQEVVVTSPKTPVLNSTTLTRTNTPLRDIPQSIQNVDRTTIEQQQLYTVNDALKNVAGVNLSSSGRFNFRGFDTRSGAFLINGQNGSPYPEGVTPLLANVERVEVLHGPSAIFYGAGAVGGNINLVTKQPKKESVVRGSIGGGSFDLFRAMADVTGSINKSKSIYFLAGVGYQNGGSQIYDYKNQNLQLYGSVKWEINPKTSWLVNLNYINDHNTSNALAEVPIFQGQLYSIDQRYNYQSNDAFYKGNNFQVQTAFQHKFTENWNANLLVNFARSSADRKQYDLGGYADAKAQSVERYITISKINSPSFVVDPYLNGKFSVAGIKNNIVVGGNLNLNRNLYPNGIKQYSASNLAISNPNRSDFDISTATLYLNSARETFTYNTVGAYIQDQIEITSKFKALAGLRYNNYFRRYLAESITYDMKNYSDFIETPERNEAWTPRFGLVYQPFTTVSLYGDYNRGFIPQYGNYTTTGGPFKPETSNQYELGIKGEFFGKTFMPTFAIYDNTKSNVLTPVSLTRDRKDPLFGKLETLGEVKSKGYEVGFTGYLFNNLNVIANYSYNETKITKSNRPTEVGRIFNNSPKNIASFWLSYTNAFVKGLQLGFGTRYTSDRFISNRDVASIDILVLPKYYVSDALVGYKFQKYSVQLNANNIFDKNYAQGSSGSNAYTPGTPRNFLFTLGYGLR